jgi:hypothetical protein
MTEKSAGFQVIIVLFLVLCMPLLIQGNSKVTINTLKDSDAAEGKIKLSLIRVWGEDDTEDINQAFYFPGDVKIDPMGNVYVLDSGHHRIQVFDKSTKFIRSIGKKGKGPGDVLAPASIALTRQQNIAVADSSNYRIQVIDKLGNYINSFRTGQTMPINFSLSSKDELLMYLPKKGQDCKWALSFYDLKGNPKEEVAVFPCIKQFACGEFISFLVGAEGDIFVSYLNIPFFQRLSRDGKKLMAVSYEVPLKTPSYQLPPGSRTARIARKKDEITHTVFCDFSVDREERIFLVAFNRPQQQKERVYLVGGGGEMARMPKEFPEETDLFRLLVFSPEGKIIAAKKLPVFCDRIYVHDGRLFVIDKMRRMKIYEYSYHF